MKINTNITRALAILTTVALSAALSGCGSQQNQEESQEAEVVQEMGVNLDVKAEGWNAETSTPVIAILKQQNFTTDDGEIVYVCDGGEEFASERDYQDHVKTLSDEDKLAHATSHVECRDESGEKVELDAIYQELAANTVETIPTKDREYTLQLVSPINSDGSIYTTPDPMAITPTEITHEATPIELALVPADQVEAAQLEDVVATVTAASEADPAAVPETTVERAMLNAQANLHTTAEENEDAELVAEETGASGPEATTAAKTTSSASVSSGSTSSSSVNASGQTNSDSSTSSGESSNAGQASASAMSQEPVAPVHTHVFNIPVYKTVTKEIMVCSGCGAPNPSPSHIENHALKGESGSTVSSVVSEQVPNGYKCSCGAIG